MSPQPTRPIRKLLVANRGEIARRVFRTARRMGIATAAVYSDADAASPHAAEADQAVRIGPAPARDSYLRGEAVLAAALSCGADAVHPGYGFLSENADFAQAVIDAGLIWVGPPPAAIRAMGLKDAAKALMAKAGVPVTPGYFGDDQSEERLAAEAQAVGYPVLIKAVAGGGGKGMRRVDRAEDFAAALASCRREAGAGFGDERVLIETYVARPRHIEVQVFGDVNGAVVHLFERDCSLQRRHQKVIEEAPAPGMSPDVRAAVCEAAVRAARAVDYVGAGTVEFIADASEGLRADRIWFMEMNTRLQVEHPVTEAVTGVDLVEWQLRAAAGEALPLTQDQIRLSGHAMEARLYAENPEAGFLPSTGPLLRFDLPTDVRVDSAVESGGAVSPFYDPMIAKLIAHGPDRATAAGRLAAACRQVRVWPVRTNAAFLARCLDDGEFLDARIDTGFIERRLDVLLRPQDPPAAVLSAAAAALRGVVGADAWTAAPLSGLRLNGPAARTARLHFDGRALDAPIGALDAQGLNVWTSGDEVVVFAEGEAWRLSRPGAEGGAGGGASAAGGGALISPMPGRIIAVHAADGQSVVRGQPLLTLEAMKMEHALAAPFDGVVTGLSAAVGDQVAEGVVLARLEAPAAAA